MVAKKTSETSSVSKMIDSLKSKYPQDSNTQKIPTGILPIDFVLGGGYVNPVFCQIAGDSGVGKALKKGTGILTPIGIVKIEDLKVGDYVLDVDGNPVKVLGHYPQGVVDLYKVEFSDNTSEICCKEHLWFVNKAVDRVKVGRRDTFYPVDTLTIMNNLYYHYAGKTKINYAIPFNKPLNFKSQSYLLHPYLLGCLLGDGYLNDNQVKFTNTDRDIICKFESLLPEGYKLINSGGCIDYRISRTDTNIPNFKEYIKSLGLDGCKSKTKFIPKNYLWNTVEVREQLLNGLMDTDGSVEHGNNSYAYWTQSKQLAEDVKFLAKSLGYKVTITIKNTVCTYKGNKIQCDPIYRVNMQGVRCQIPVTCSTKLTKKTVGKLPQRRVKYIKNIVPYGKDEAFCIKVDSPSSTYITENFTVTHNTTIALSMTKSLVKKGHRILYLNFEQAPIQALIEDMGMGNLPEEQFLVLAPATIGEGEDCINELILKPDEPLYDHIVFDSVGGMVPDYLDSDDIDSTDSTPAIRARQMSKFFEMNTYKIKRKKVSCWFINHLSLKIETGYGKKSEKTSKGGTAVQYWTDIWLWVERGSTLDQKASDNVTGGYNDKDYYANIATVQVQKGKSGGMKKKTELPVFFGKGISNLYWLFLVLKNAGEIKTNGSFYKCTLLKEEGVNNQGIPKTLKYLKDNQKEITAAMKAKGLWNFFDKDEELPDEV